jgi:hypothetical protein
VLRTGWNRSVDTAAATPTGGVVPVDWKQQAEELQRRIGQLEAAAARTTPVSAHADEGDTEVLRRVSAMIGQSEKRQERAMGARLTQITQNIDARRKIDLALIDQGLMRLQTTNVAELRQSRDLMQRMYRQTAYQPK